MVAIRGEREETMKKELLTSFLQVALYIVELIFFMLNVFFAF